MDIKCWAVGNSVGNGLAVGESIVKNQWKKLGHRGI